jgi:hypothetical protein
MFSSKLARPDKSETLCNIRIGLSGTGTGFSRSSSVLPCQYHPTATPYSLMYHLGAGQWAR